MTLNQLSIWAIGISFLSGCGGGNKATATPPGNDISIPVVGSVFNEPLSNGKLYVTANANDNTGVTGYCFLSANTKPLGTDKCFTSAASQTIDIPTTASPTYFVWAKDAANNVSATYSIDIKPPSIASTSVSAPNSDKEVTLSVNASDNTAVTGYCFTTTLTTPVASDACFMTQPTSKIKTPQTTALYAWAKDAAGNISAPFNAGCSSVGLAASQASKLPTVCMSTSLGEMVVELEASKAPFSTTNFLKYVNDGYYSQTVFHRILRNFAIQGGGFTAVPISSTNTKAGTIYPAIQLEKPVSTGLSNTKGTLAMARATEENSATREFFINTVDNLALNTNGGGYAVFGKVISGLDTTVEAIRSVQVQTNSSGEDSQPVTPPVINWAYQLK